MYNFETLEKRCKRYYLKKYVLFFILFLVVVAIATASMMFLNKKTTLPHDKSTIVKKYIAKKKVVVREKIKTKIPKPSKVKVQKRVESFPLTKKLEGNTCYSLQFFVANDLGLKYLYLKEKKLKKLGFDCSIHKGKSLFHLLCGETKNHDEFQKSKKLAHQYDLEYSIRKVQCSQAEYKQKKAKKIEKIVAEVKPRITKEDTFVLQSQKFDATHLKKLFQKRKSYSIALKLAQYYSNAKEYENAVVWAKKANSIDKTDAESWIIYAQSLYALGDKEKAKKILHIYLEFENSKQVNKILSHWSNK